MSGRTLLGMLTPSSNTVLEPACAAMLHDTPDITAHFARFRVTEIALDRAALDQFDQAPMLEAASLLADARVHAICWNGTSAAWLGLEADRALCAAITARTGIPACTAVLGTVDVFRRTGLRRYGMVSPYTPDVQERIVATFRSEGFDCVAERHLGIRENFAFSEVSAATLREKVRDVARAKPEAIIVFCTNLAGAKLAEALEQEMGIPVYDSTAVALWAALRAAKADPRRITGWGRLFREVG